LLITLTKMESIISNNILTQSHSQEARHAFGKNDTGQQGQQSHPVSQPAFLSRILRKQLIFITCYDYLVLDNKLN